MKRNACLVILIFATFLFAISIASSTPTTSAASFAGGPKDRAELESFMDGAVNAELKAHNIPGATVALVRGDQLPRGIGSEKRVLELNFSVVRLASSNMKQTAQISSNRIPNY